MEITPPELLPLGGYTARKGKSADPGGEPLYARVLILERVTIVALDMLTIPAGFAEAVQDRVGKKDIWLVATHTHCAPDSQMLNPKMTMAVPGIGSYNPRLFDWYVKRVSDAVWNAQYSAPKMALALNLKTFPLDLVHGRRKGAFPDKTGWVLMADNSPILAAFGAHATLLDEKWNQANGDWPGLLAKKLDCAVVPASIGDMAPNSMSKDPVENLQLFVEKFRSRVSKTEARELKIELGDLVPKSSECALSAPVPHPSFSKEYGVPDVLAQVLVGKFAQTSCKIQCFTIGPLLVIGIPGEPTAEVGREIARFAAQKSFPHCLVLSHSNGWIGYILKPTDYDTGGYEATLSFNGRDTSERIIASAKTMISSYPKRRRDRDSAIACN